MSDQREEAAQVEEYTTPKINLLGNMNDLLGGSGSFNTDGNCEPNAQATDPDCGPP